VTSPSLRGSTNRSDHPRTKDSVRQTLRFFAALALAAGALGCGADSTGVQTVATHLRGTWAEPNEVPGSSLSMVLTTQDTVVTGTGAYTNEAGPSGTTTIAGTVAGATINLDVTFDNNHVMHFRGALAGNTKLQGIWYSTPVGDPVNIEFDKVQ
jgi:hypothetical protein